MPHAPDELWQAEDRHEEHQHHGISWWLALTIFTVLVVAIIYLFYRSSMNREREQMCWRFVRTGHIGSEPVCPPCRSSSGGATVG